MTKYSYRVFPHMYEVYLYDGGGAIGREDWPIEPAPGSRLAVSPACVRVFVDDTDDFRPVTITVCSADVQGEIVGEHLGEAELSLTGGLLRLGTLDDERTIELSEPNHRVNLTLTMSADQKQIWALLPPGIDIAESPVEVYPPDILVASPDDLPPGLVSEPDWSWSPEQLWGFVVRSSVSGQRRIVSRERFRNLRKTEYDADWETEHYLSSDVMENYLETRRGGFPGMTALLGGGNSSEEPA